MAAIQLSNGASATSMRAAEQRQSRFARSSSTARNHQSEIVAIIAIVVLAIAGAVFTQAQEKSYVWVNEPQQLILNPPLRAGEKFDPALWFDQDNAVLYRSHAFDLIRETIGCQLLDTASDSTAAKKTEISSKEMSLPPTKLAGQLQKCVGGKNEKPVFPGPNDYVVIHTLRWKDPAKDSTAQSIDKQNWYVFYNGNKIDWDDDAYAKNNRIFGSKRIYLLYIHFNRAVNSKYLARYTMTSKKKTPAYLLHFASLIQVFGAGTGQGGPEAAKVRGAVPNAFWNATPLDTYYVPSDLTFAPTMLPYPTSSLQAPADSETPGQTPVASPPSDVTPTTGTETPVGTNPAPSPVPGTPSNSSTLPTVSQTVPGENKNPQLSAQNSLPNPSEPSGTTDSIPTEVKLDTQVFDNEGLYHFDFTVAVPIRKISEISYVSSSNTLIPTKIDKQTTFGVFDYYYKPIDIKGSGWSLYPHALAGVAIDSHPLKRVLIGGGYGPLLAHFYMGLVLDTQSLPSGGSCGSIPTSQQLASSKLHNRICPGLSLGLNVSVGSVLDSLKPKSSTGSGSKSK